MTRLETVVSIHGAPRSGTTWLARLLALHPAAVFRYQPFFSWKFKGRIDAESSSSEVVDLLEEIFTTDDPFVRQEGPASLGGGLLRPSREHPNLMIMKSVRYHELARRLLLADDRVQAVGIVRHPCAVINSWLRSPREFPRDGDPSSSWRHALDKNGSSSHEFWGFERWQYLLRLFLQLEEEFAGRFRLVQYERMVSDLEAHFQQLSEWMGHSPSPSVLTAARASQQSASTAHDYEVVKSPMVAERWRDELEPEIRAAIELELDRGEYDRFGWRQHRR